jgi:hypothetical protein
MNEQRAAWEASLAARLPDDTDKINEALAAGRFVVVQEGTEYCPHTDGILGSRKTLLGDFAMPEEAMECYQNNQEPAYSDIDVYLLPSENKVEQNQPPLSDNDIPF